MSQSKPLISFALFTYNQEKYIRDAVQAAFAQTYSPLEIVISDDCSQDKTADIVSALIRGYQGPHKIRFNRNERNLGIGGHVNKVMLELVKGDLIVMAAGDDISVPGRVEAIYRAWLDSGRKASLILSGYQRMTVEGERGKVVRPVNEQGFWRETLIGYLKRNRPLIVPGCVEACHRTLFENFGPITQAPDIEDNVIAARAMLTGGVWLIPDVLVFWRMSGAVSKVKDPAFMWLQDIRYRRQSVRQLLKDIDAVKISFRISAYIRYVCKANLLLATVESLLLRIVGWLLLVPVCRPLDSVHNFKRIHRRLGELSLRRLVRVPTNLFTSAKRSGQRSQI